MPDWLLAILIGVVVTGLLALIWHTHETHDKERDKSLWDQVGRDSQSGMRKTTHDAYNMGLSNKGLIERLEDRVKEIANKVFNGHKP